MNSPNIKIVVFGIYFEAAALIKYASNFRKGEFFYANRARGWRSPAKIRIDMNFGKYEKNGGNYEINY